MAAEAVDRSRRSFLRGRLVRRNQGPPPPWTRAASFAAGCTGCGDCIDACPEQILRRGPIGLAEVDFAKTGCSFCGACAKACPEGLFDLARAPAWNLTVTISEACLAARQVVCQSCRDACAAAAIVFRPALGGVASPHVEAAGCTACGSCVSACPVTAISLQAVEWRPDRP